MSKPLIYRGMEYYIGKQDTKDYESVLNIPSLDFKAKSEKVSDLQTIAEVQINEYFEPKDEKKKEASRKVIGIVDSLDAVDLVEVRQALYRALNVVTDPCILEDINFALGLIEGDE